MKQGKKFLDIITRYLLLALFSLGGLGIFYFVFTPLTLYPVFFILGFFYTASIQGTTVYVNSTAIEIINACVAGSAYYLLLIFNLSTPGIRKRERVVMILSSFLIFLLANIARIVVLSAMYISGTPFFDITHKLLWYLGSTILVVGIWFYQAKSHKVKAIPAYSDLKFLHDNSIRKLLKTKVK